MQVEGRIWETKNRTGGQGEGVLTGGVGKALEVSRGPSVDPVQRPPAEEERRGGPWGPFQCLEVQLTLLGQLPRGHWSPYTRTAVSV